VVATTLGIHKLLLKIHSKLQSYSKTIEQLKREKGMKIGERTSTSF